MDKKDIEYWETPAGVDRPSLDGTDYSQAPALSGYHPVNNFHEYTVRNDVKTGRIWHSSAGDQPYIQLTARSPRWGATAPNLMSNLQFTVCYDQDLDDYYLSALADPRVPWNHVGAYQLYRYEMHEAEETIKGQPVKVISDHLYWVHERARASVGGRFGIVTTFWRWVNG